MYFVFFIFVFFYFYRLGELAKPIIESFNIPRGFASVPTLSTAAICSLWLFWLTNNKKQVLSQLLSLLLLWTPWLLYMAYRCDFNDPYSTKKLLLMIFAQFGTLSIICLAFFKDKECFQKYFFICTISMTTLLLIVFYINHVPDIETSTTLVTRYTTHNINPIALSRVFAIGAISLMLWGRFPYWVSICLSFPFIVAMYLTGSRGPMIAVLIVIVCHYLWTQSVKKLAFLRVFFSCLLILISLSAVKASFDGSIDTFLTRGNPHGMFKGSGRYGAFVHSWKEFVSSPLIGVGLGKYESRNHLFSNMHMTGAIIRKYPHNIFYEVLVELGIIGAIFFVLLIFPGRWMLDLSNKFVFLFFLCTLFALTSGDFFDNTGFFIFSYIARLNATAQERSGI